MKRIYLAGAMTGVPKEYYEGWRRYVEEVIENDFDVINPARLFDLEKDTDYGSMTFDLYEVGRSDVVLVNFDYNPNSVGTAFELAEARRCNVPVVGYVSKKYKDMIHPWMKLICNKLFVDDGDNFYDIDDAINWIEEVI
jgi:nucleoside 2-deoxyribosyltransferase